MKYQSNLDFRVIINVVRVLFIIITDNVNSIEVYSFTDHYYGILVLVIMYPIYNYFV